MADPVSCENLPIEQTHFYIIDKVIPREKLGKGVLNTSMFMKNRTSDITADNNRGTYHSLPPATGGSSATGSGGGDALALPATGDRNLQRNRSDDPADWISGDHDSMPRESPG